MPDAADATRNKTGLLRNAALILGVSVFLLAVGWYAHCWHLSSGSEHRSRRAKAPGYTFTSPLLDVELPEGFSINNEPFPFKNKVVNYVNSATDGTRVRNISVYYRDLSDGPWFGINEKLDFNPASLMKVPVMIAWLKRAENRPGVLEQTFQFDGSADMTKIQLYKPAVTLVAGQRYSVEKLLEYMIAYSDNNALSLLYNNMTKEELKTVIEGMDISYKTGGRVNTMTVHGYSGFFRILYNASFLSRNMSEKALQLLSHEDFPQGIRAGVPKGVTIAGKFGEHGGGDSGEEQQLHEFGIVYHPKGAYILGVMTQGHDLVRQTEIIRDVSALVYREVDNDKHIGN